MDGKNFFESLYNVDCLEDTEVPLSVLLRMTLELGRAEEEYSQ